MMFVPLPQVSLKRTSRIGQGYPWVYSNEIDMTSLPHPLISGALVEFCDMKGRFLGIGTINKHALISGRVYSRDQLTSIDENWFETKFKAAQALREKMRYGHCYRLVHADADELSGLIIDRFEHVVVAQVNTAGMELLKNVWVPALMKACPFVKTLILRYDSQSRSLESLDTLPPEVIGEPLPSSVVQGQEGPIRFLADVLEGQKTGWFFDQRDNRHKLAQWVQPGMRALDLFTHTGSFGLYLAHAGAVVTAVDRSHLAIDLAKAASKLNGFAQEQIQWVQSEVFSFLQAHTQSYDLIMVDPPAFIKNKSNIAAGIQGYKKLLTQVVPFVKKSGLLCFTSCSHHTTLDSLNEILLDAVKAHGRRACILQTYQAGSDHPVDLRVPELAYLKGILIKLDD